MSTEKDEAMYGKTEAHMERIYVYCVKRKRLARTIIKPYLLGIPLSLGNTM
jgi:hypothetical protein